MKTIAFFNNKGGVGKTSMVYHLAWMFADMGHRVLAADLDPQSNLTSMFLDEPRLEQLWPDGEHPETILGALSLVIDRMGDIKEIKPIEVATGLSIIAGDLGLSTFEDRVSEAWGNCTVEDAAPDGFRVISAFFRVMLQSSRDCDAQYVLIDVGPSVGALNRAALVAADFVVIPIGADLFSLQGLRNLGPTLKKWRNGWLERKSSKRVPSNLSLPSGNMTPLGYVLLNPSVRANRPLQSYLKWANRIPATYSREILDQAPIARLAADDPNELGMLKHFKSLMPMAQDARKPMFRLTAADGAIGGHAGAVRDCYSQFQLLAERILKEVELGQG